MNGFEGRIGRTLADSEPHFTEPVHPGEDAPNVVVILMDDTGFAQFGCYGSDIDTPNVDAPSKPACSSRIFRHRCVRPRGCAIDGSLTARRRDAWCVNWRTGFPHQLGHISNSAATTLRSFTPRAMPPLCRQVHLAPTQDISAAGPFDQWPLARGFDRYYGFEEKPTSSTPNWFETTATLILPRAPTTATTSPRTWSISCCR